jgi:hypothetical protein
MSKLKARAPDAVTPGKCKGLIFGAAGVGKTWFSLEFPAPYYIDTEGGARLVHYQDKLKASHGSYFGQEDGALDFAAVIGQVQALATEKHQYKTLIIDSITKLYQIAISQESERLGDKDAFGASKKPAIANMRKLVNWVSRLDMNVWFISHETNEWGQNPKSGQREEIGKMPDIWDKLAYELDLGLRVIRQGKSYPAIGIVTKSRLTGFPLGETFPLEYAPFAERYGKDYIESAVVTIDLATQEQVAEIVRLADLIKLPAETAEKMLTKAKAETWAELNTKQAADTIKWLNNKITGKE